MLARPKLKCLALIATSQMQRVEIDELHSTISAHTDTIQELRESIADVMDGS